MNKLKSCFECGYSDPDNSCEFCLHFNDGVSRGRICNTPHENTCKKCLKACKNLIFTKKKKFSNASLRTFWEVLF